MTTKVRFGSIKKEKTMEEIVKCKDCKYAHLTYDGECKYCDMWDSDDALYLPVGFFCAFAEKKEERRQL